MSKNKDKKTNDSKSKKSSRDIAQEDFERLTSFCLHVGNDIAGYLMASNHYSDEPLIDIDVEDYYPKLSVSLPIRDLDMPNGLIGAKFYFHAFVWKCTGKENKFGSYVSLLPTERDPFSYVLKLSDTVKRVEVCLNKLKKKSDFKVCIGTMIPQPSERKEGIIRYIDIYLPRDMKKRLKKANWVAPANTPKSKTNLMHSALDTKLATMAKENTEDLDRMSYEEYNKRLNNAQGQPNMENNGFGDTPNYNETQFNNANAQPSMNQQMNYSEDMYADYNYNSNRQMNHAQQQPKTSVDTSIYPDMALNSNMNNMQGMQQNNAFNQSLSAQTQGQEQQMYSQMPPMQQGFNGQYNGGMQAQTNNPYPTQQQYTQSEYVTDDFLGNTAPNNVFGNSQPNMGQQNYFQDVPQQGDTQNTRNYNNSAWFSNQPK